MIPGQPAAEPNDRRTDEVTGFEANCRLADLSRRQARARSGLIAISFEGRDTTYAELDLEARRVGRGLSRSGCRPGDRVAVLAKNHDAWFPLIFGSALAGCCVTPINSRLAVPEVAFILEDAGSRLLFVGEGLFDLALAASALLTDPPRLVALFGDHDGFASYAEWRATGDDDDVVHASSPDDEVVQIYTSGTTGRPKGAVFTNGNYGAFVALAVQVDGFAYQPGDPVYMVMPLFHVAGLNTAIVALAQGARLVLDSDFVPDRLPGLLRERRIAHLFLAPAMIAAVVRLPAAGAAPYPDLQTIGYGSSPISERVLGEARRTFGCRFVQFYGMTESMGAGSCLSPPDHDLPGKLVSCGRPWPHIEMMVADERGAEVPRGRVGEIVIRGSIVMKGYWRRPEASAATLVDGWLHTGDAGICDENGYFFVRDRMKDMIVSGGENVYPAEVENAIASHPDVVDVAVIGVPDERWGEAVKAIIVAASDRQPTGEDIRAWARKRIAAFKVPRSVEFVDALPRNASGKVLRRQLRERHWAGLARSI